MLHAKHFRLICFACALILLVVAFGLLFIHEQRYCLNVPLISRNDINQYNEDTSLDITQLIFDGKPVPADPAKNTIYISQPESSLSRFSNLRGSLTSVDPTWSLFFINDPSIDHLSTSVQKGTPLSLVVTCGDKYHIVNVVITTLPIICLSGSQTHVNENQQAVLTGSLTIWSDPEKYGYPTQTSTVQWHVRGYSSAGHPKNPWKLSLKKKDGENNHLDLLGLGADDDWILNSLTMDDTKIREKLFFDIWNTLAASTNYNYRMSDGEYAEVIINNTYMGVYLLQRRIDAKYLQLSEDDVLLKAVYYGAASAQQAYEFVTTEQNTEEIYSLMQDVFTKSNCASFHLHNFVDVNLMIQFASALDNCGLKNMYHLLKHSESGYVQYLIPWDTDMSFGIGLKDGVDFCYNMNSSLGWLGKRDETVAISALHTDYDQVTCEQWKSLREHLLSEEAIIQRIDELNSQLVNSGSFTRDVTLWGFRYGESDTVDNLKTFIRLRLDIMDDLYR